MSWRKWCAGCVLSALLPAAAASAQEWIPIEVRDGALTFPALVEGAPITAALDTGSSINSVDSALAQQLGLSLSGPRYRIQGAFSTREVVASEAQLDTEIFGVKVSLRDTPVLHHADTPLLIGVGFLRSFILQIDYPASRMRVLSRESIDLDEHDNVPMQSAEGTCNALLGRGPCLPAIQVIFPRDKKLWLLLDTGATGSIVLNRLVAKREGWLEEYRKGHTAGSDVFGKVSELEMLVIPTLRVGPFELGDVPVAVPVEGEGVQTGRESWGRAETGTHITRGARVNGLLGYDVLRHFVLTIDYGRELLHIAAPQPVDGAARAVPKRD